MTNGFDAAQHHAEPTRDDKANATAAHTEVREVLEAESLLMTLGDRFGLDQLLIGSYKREVSIS